ncbi:hypothetical protein EVAR_67135_1 [Eumeta japonica]|uniref:Uncharacterized protein n=1 Tax=Eumeta variegata TaxID=151549 RepID=A0A4C1ZV33_EUMVA|nr:hypothetical protein EVAR_67135_1 [Eumeta japonica]
MNYLLQECAKKSLKGKQAPQAIAKPGLTRNKLMLSMCVNVNPAFLEAVTALATDAVSSSGAEAPSRARGLNPSILNGSILAGNGLRLRLRNRTTEGRRGPNLCPRASSALEKSSLIKLQCCRSVPSSRSDRHSTSFYGILHLQEKMHETYESRILKKNFPALLHRAAAIPQQHLLCSPVEDFFANMKFYVSHEFVTDLRRAARRVVGASEPRLQ